MQKLGLFYYLLLLLCVSVVSLTSTGCGSKTNQTIYNRPNTVIYDHIHDPPNFPKDPQLRSVSVVRPLKIDESVNKDLDQWVWTADVIKPVHADLLADKGLPTGIYRKQLFSNAYECVAQPIKVKGNIIRFQVTGDRDGTVNEYQLTLTAENHTTLAEAKQAFLERVEVLYKHINWGVDMEPVIRQSILYEKFAYPSDDETVPELLRIAERRQPEPDPNFKYHSFDNQRWTTPLNYDVEETIGGRLRIWREPLTENGYRWGAPFVIRVILEPYGYP